MESARGENILARIVFCDYLESADQREIVPNLLKINIVTYLRVNTKLSSAIFVSDSPLCEHTSMISMTHNSPIILDRFPCLALAEIQFSKIWESRNPA